jgi:hypothetical protein
MLGGSGSPIPQVGDFYDSLVEINLMILYENLKIHVSDVTKSWLTALAQLQIP